MTLKRLNKGQDIHPDWHWGCGGEQLTCVLVVGRGGLALGAGGGAWRTDLRAGGGAWPTGPGGWCPAAGTERLPSP